MFKTAPSSRKFDSRKFSALEKEGSKKGPAIAGERSHVRFSAEGAKPDARLKGVIRSGLA
jgi:hypothetical protein